LVAGGGVELGKAIERVGDARPALRRVRGFHN
jgi:hypothetical protein